jgi:carboxypeptidase family protein
MNDRSLPLRAVRLALLGFALAVWAAGCGSASPGTSATSTLITSPAAAVAAVMARNPGFAGIRPADPNAIGQCCSYRATASGSDFVVEIEVGWGDCQAGCINRHHWSYTVTRTAVVILAHEDGPPVPAGLPAAGGVPGSRIASGGAGGSGGPATGIGIEGTATAGPVCPVSRPGDTNCADRPVAGATIHIVGSDGREVATVTTDANGHFAVDLPAGNYQVVADAAQGLMAAPEPVSVSVAASVVIVKLQYDTGIR